MRKIHRLMSLAREVRWTLYNVGFIERQICSEADFGISDCKVHWLDTEGYTGGWFADPFILDTDGDTVILLAEEMWGSLGRLVKLKVSRQGYRLLDVKPLLELDTHLSFPNYISDSRGNMYIYPENYQGGALKIYHFNKATDQLSDPIKLVDEPLVDSQIIEYEGIYYIFAVKHDSDPKKMLSTLYVYASDELLGRYELVQVLEHEYPRMRGAGSILKLQGALYRPVQKCDNRYGEATIIRRLEKVDGKWTERDIATLNPDPKSRWGMVLHTFNTLGDIVVIDGLGWKHPRLHAVLGPILDLVRPI